MPSTKRGRGRPRTQTVSDVKLSLMDIEEEIGDSTIFEGVLAHAKLQKKYTENPKDKEMSLKGFEEKIEEFKKQKIYKTTPQVKEEESPEAPQNPTSPTEEKEEGGN